MESADMVGVDSVLVTHSLLDVGCISASVTSPSTGATSLFVGTTRDNFGGKKVVKLEYEAYEGMATKELAKLCVSLRSRWGNLHKIAIHHRLGEVKVTEASVVIAISSPHRKESLEAVHYCIDQLKATVPIWKKEIYEEEEGGTWKENKECSWTDGGSGTTDGANFIKEGGSEAVSCQPPQMIPLDPTMPPQMIPLDPTLIQVNASRAELSSRIAAFIGHKRSEVDRANCLEFCQTGGESCARVGAVVTRRLGSKSHLRTSEVENREQDWILAKTVKKEPMDGTVDTSLPLPLENRFGELEAKVFFRENEPVPRDIYQRFKDLEHRLQLLEGLSPEYRDSFRVVRERDKQEGRRMLLDRRKGLLSRELKEINSKINLLVEYLKT